VILDVKFELVRVVSGKKMIKKKAALKDSPFKNAVYALLHKMNFN